MILLVADLAWQVLKTLIDRRLAAAQGAGELEGDEAAREARLRTLLPIFRNIAFVVLAVVAVMMALSASACRSDRSSLAPASRASPWALVRRRSCATSSAASSTSSTNAFRVGEYIQSGSYKGTVESFSLCSVKLRHHRVPVYTVPFGQLGAVQNMSRDWVIDKMTVGVTYDSDIDKAKKLIKQIGRDLAADPELGRHIIEGAAEVG